ncbi:hypothetical protein CFOL_v3_04691, partial [Cephalotus follicularis]
IETGPENSPGPTIFKLEPKTVRDTFWRQNVPPDHPLNHLLEQVGEGINLLISDYSWGVPIFVLQ